MPTIRQKRFARGIVDAIEKGEVLSAGAIARNSGYGKNIQEHPKYALEAEGTKQALQELGFSLEAAKEKTAQILNAPVKKRKITPEHQLRAADMVFRAYGAYHDTPPPLNIEKAIIFLPQRDGE